MPITEPMGMNLPRRHLLRLGTAFVLAGSLPLRALMAPLSPVHC